MAEEKSGRPAVLNYDYPSSKCVCLLLVSYRSVLSSKIGCSLVWRAFRQNLDTSFVPISRLSPAEGGEKIQSFTFVSTLFHFLHGKNDTM